MTQICGKVYDNPGNVLHLRLSSMGIQSLDGNELLQFPNVEVLDLYENRLNVLPDELCQLTKLRILRLDNNRLVSLPEDLSNLEKLTELNITHNYISNLPPNMEHMANLKVLYANGNYLTIDYFNDWKIKVFSDDSKASNIIPSSSDPSLTTFNMNRPELSEYVKYLNRKYANKGVLNMTKYNTCEEGVAKHKDTMTKSLEYMYELVAKSGNLYGQTRNTTYELLNKLNESGIIVEYNDDYYKTLLKINEFMFDLLDETQTILNTNNMETFRYFDELSRDVKQCKQKLHNMTITNEEMIRHNETLRSNMKMMIKRESESSKVKRLREEIQQLKSQNGILDHKYKELQTIHSDTKNKYKRLQKKYNE